LIARQLKRIAVNKSYMSYYHRRLPSVVTSSADIF